ncbi:group I truncated hemoglobin [Halomonas sp. M20]|uniref:group I truncated hemoglobin n=1 Tax=Halomonas sp. M20 TaxID=2763264 RepID=UPI001D0A28D5|nr:group 1 truncated hemoglobin [Halomonas sp. M20]
MTTMIWRRLTAPLLLAICTLTAHASDDETSSWTYNALGEKAGIAAIVEDLLVNIANDERIVVRFADADISRLQRMLNEQFCMLSGGPCVYTGDSMRESHRGKNYTQAEFNSLVENLIHAFEANDVPLAAQNRLLGKLAPMNADIVAQ